ncbi:serine threonine-protein phosphatase 4 catalytic subunit, putative [Ichthyophthirius multifiliis]|uniref:Serine/threonine-protein phosphatase n=1 Tax=Ichthyophthirius multifiliis TaxID=5932 RepID=G0QZB5_ICHMU|nr:serine threonine-protein phosphatase 4 catalytic subunit, putative [Ichthyophthirius multifiliis]EGR29418.1 serine threonine-protein phosphatase 4 catalytic subunit, putative [Ichthyophthirius multifiliis]|eukprot:XP_004030654.1 serine threonine-protein phosphatase 4 catalytic subunit, putative [Ichthyophthirius multifiliis]
MQNDIDKQLNILQNGELLKENEVKILCARVREVFIEESNVQRIDSPVTICGDIHGQFYDLLELFKNGGLCPDINYLFLGDYVNRGHHSIETIIFLFALKIKYSDRITLLRGNHESKIITQVFGFYDECLRKYGSLNVWRYITEVFEYMTISALIDDKIFCTHGGIASDVKNLDDVNIYSFINIQKKTKIRQLDRVKEIPAQGEMCELLWNDPEENTKGFKENQRGHGKTFGQDVFNQFLQINNLNKMIRAHQLIMEGYKQIWDESCVTVWSCPNYCYRCGNIGSIMQIKHNNEINFKTFDASKDQLKGAGTKMSSNVPDYFL